MLDEVEVGDWDRHIVRGKWPTVPANTVYRDCVTPSQWNEVQTSAPYARSTTVELKSEQDLLFLVARGSSSFGTVRIVQTSDVGTTVRVTTVVEYNQPDALKQTRVCSVGNKKVGRSDGVAILTWVHPPVGLDMTWNVLVELPATSNGSPLQLNAFTTDMPIFAHEVHDLSSVFFRSLSLSTTDKPISVEALSGRNAYLMTTNAAIEGTFKTSSALTLSTINAHINATAALVNGGGAVKATELTVSTTNALINTAVSLYSSNRDNTGGQFAVSATSSRAAVTVAFPTAPVDSKLSLDASTSLAPATVTLHKTYEGAFALATSLSKATLDYQRNVTDPAGRGRHREVQVGSQSAWKIDGTVAWISSGAASEDTPAAGCVKVTSSLAAVALKL
jgi:hypothetical protein